MKARLWMVRCFGLRTYLRYRTARRRGDLIDYGTVLTADERAVLEEHMESVPWSPSIVRKEDG